MEECCAKCDEHFHGDQELAEVYDPADPEGPAALVHVSCIPDGWKLA